MTLHQLPINQSTIIKSIRPPLAQQTAQLSALGFHQGNTIRIIRRSRFSKKIEVCVLSSHFTLRADDAKCIEVAYD